MTLPPRRLAPRPPAARTRRSRLRRRAGLLLAAGLAVGSLGTLRASAGADSAAGPPVGRAGSAPWAGTVRIDEHQRYGTDSDGDLWPSCWGGDGNLYAANGDGKGFSQDGPFADIAVNRIAGRPPALTGETLARSDEVSSIWSGAGYNRKPTGMVCVGNTIYLAVQDLALNFDDVPAATIVKSTDGGRTWTWDRRRPMFDHHVFTTVFFADFGRGGEWNPDRYVYAYGLDGNWRDSFSDSVADPTDVYLARVPKDRVQQRSAWEFYAGRTASGAARWSSDVGRRRAVLHDPRQEYRQVFDTNRISRLTVLGQGGVLYDKPLRRYLYLSWTEYTFEFYESPTPWGPWRRLATKDFGGYPWSDGKHGGYATTAPSKFLSADGRTLLVQSNVCPCGGGGSVYHYSLRRVDITPHDTAPAGNPLAPDTDLATPEHGAVPISKSARLGRLDLLTDGATTGSEDDNDGEVKPESWWGVTWPRAYHLDHVEFTSGEVNGDGGWFVGQPRVQVRRGGTWHEVVAQTVSPAYPGDASAGAHTTYTFAFAPTDGDGVRVIGQPGGSHTYTSASEFQADYRTQVVNGGFEAGAAGRQGWDFEGTANRGVDRGLGFAHSGRNNGWIRTSDTGWSAYTQRVPVTPGHTYTFSAWIRSSGSLTDGRFGVRSGAAGSAPLDEVRFGAAADYTRRQVTVTAPAGRHVLTLYAGLDAPGTDTWIQVDDVSGG